MTPTSVAQTLVAQIFIATLMTSNEIDEFDEFDELDEYDECDEFDELGISFIGRVVHGAMLKKCFVPNAKTAFCISKFNLFQNIF